MCAVLVPSVRAQEAAKDTTLAERDARTEYFQVVQKAKELAAEQQRNRERLQKLELLFLETNKKIEASKKQWQLAASELAKNARDDAKIQFESGELKIFYLRHIPAADGAKAIDTLFGSKSMRVAIDDRTNSIIVLGEVESLPKVESLLAKLDQLPPQEAPKQKPQESDQPSARPLLVKMFWLADGLPAEDGKEPAEALPASVLRATTKLGLTDPRLVAQTVNSIVIRGNEGSQFSVNMPVQLLQQEVNLSADGNVSLKKENTVDLNIEVNVDGNHVKSDLGGSLTMPVDHFMVLGTSSSMIPEFVTVPAAKAGFAGEMGAAGNVGQVQRFRTSRFAFVVQVVDAQSFAPEEK